MVRARHGPHDRCMSEDDPECAGSLPALLAEYGRLAAELPAACPQRAQLLHERLAELDVAIEEWVTELDTPRL